MRLLVSLVALAVAGCLGADDRLLVGATTSVDDAGLLDVLVRAFEEASGLRVQPVVGGTGEIVEKAKRGDVDVLLTHSPARERRLLAEGWTLERRPVMFDRFVLAGPATDPARLRDATDVSGALRRIHDGAHLFASRSDESGTHEKELELWASAGLDPATFDPAWYKETGSGQGATLRFADERSAYLLVDEATLLRHHALGSATRTVPLGPDAPALRNQYAVSLPDAARTGASADGARAFVAWLTGPDGQAAIAGHALDGRPLFTPNANETGA